MRWFTFLLALLASTHAATVRTGLDVLAASNFHDLAGKRVGLVVNHSAIDGNRRHVLDLIASATDVRVVRIFSPEHGLAGIADDKVASSTYEPLGVPIFSLYGERIAPTTQSLADLDALVYDMQDIGARFYTYIITLARVMQVAAACDKEVWVLDRPNPVGGLVVAGPIMETSLLRIFRGPFPLPTQHGMTVGELAGMFNEHFGIRCKLRIVRMEGWKRGMYFDETGLPWVDPSPNMRSLSAALLYPGLGILEVGNFSVGRGTDTPFEVYGAPWLDARELCARLGDLSHYGVALEVIDFTPAAYKFAGQLCHGFRARIIERKKLDALRIYLLIARELLRLHPKQYDPGDIAGHIGSSRVLPMLREGKSMDEIEASWQPELKRFQQARRKYLLYE